jgi:exonuclease III
MNKKEAIKQTLKENHVDICCMQEVELQQDYPSQLMTFPGFSIEVEKNDTKSRVAMLIKSEINYTRCSELEGTNSNLMVVDINNGTKLRLINIYRSFAPQNNIGQREKFKYQLHLMKNAITKIQ